jgi:hypothetical protein
VLTRSSSGPVAEQLLVFLCSESCSLHLHDALDNLDTLDTFSFVSWASAKTIHLAILELLVPS